MHADTVARCTVFPPTHWCGGFRVKQALCQEAVRLGGSCFGGRMALDLSLSRVWELQRWDKTVTTNLISHNWGEKGVKNKHTKPKTTLIKEESSYRERSAVEDCFVLLFIIRILFIRLVLHSTLNMDATLTGPLSVCMPFSVSSRSLSSSLSISLSPFSLSISLSLPLSLYSFHHFL